MSSRAEQLATALNAQRIAFKAFVVARVGGEAVAENILQDGLLKALQRSGELRNNTKLSDWFYRLLSKAIIDHHRSRAARHRRDDMLSASHAALGEDVDATATPDWDAQI